MHSQARYLSVFSLGLLVLLTSVPISTLSSVSAAPAILVDASVKSTNWSGYAVTGATGSISIAQGSWAVPSVTCGVGETSYSAFWVGIDGFTSSTVEQTGTDSDCSNGVPHYYAWFEFFPNPSRLISTLVVSPGDEIAARVTYSASAGTFQVAIKDYTTGKAFSTSHAVSGAARSSAEFIVEAPAICGIFHCSLAKLSNFGTANFGGDTNPGLPGITCAVQMNGNLAALGSYGSSVQQISMVSQSNSNVIKAQPSALSTDGTSFSVQWLNAGP